MKAVPTMLFAFVGSTAMFGSLSWPVSPLSEFGIMLTTLTLPISSARLAQALDTTPDEILTATPAAAPEPPLDRRFLRRLKHVEKLSAHQKKLLLGI